MLPSPSSRKIGSASRQSVGRPVVVAEAARDLARVEHRQGDAPPFAEFGEDRAALVVAGGGELVVAELGREEPERVERDRDPRAVAHRAVELQFRPRRGDRLGEVALPPGQGAGPVQPLGAHGVRGVRRGGQGAVDRGPALAQQPLGPPEAPEGAGQPQRRRRVALGDQPVDRRQQIGVVGAEAVGPGALIRPGQHRLRALGQGQEVAGMAIADARLLPRRGQALQRVLADRFQHLVARLAVRLPHLRDQALLDEDGERVENVVAEVLSTEC